MNRRDNSHVAPGFELIKMKISQRQRSNEMAFDKEILALFKPVVVPITIEYKGNLVQMHAKELSAKQVFAMQKKQKAGAAADSDEFMVSLIAESLCDENGAPKVTYEEARDLFDSSINAFNKVAEAVATAVGLRSEVKADGTVKNV